MALHILSIYTYDYIPSNSGDHADLLTNSDMCLITLVLTHVLDHFIIVGF
jgi:hypothetical protein